MGTSGARDENDLERADRNWDELLGELRVTQTGVAILFSVLLTVPFSARFEDVDGFKRAVYLLALVLSAATTATLIGPVAYHRVLFSQGHKQDLVQHADRLARLGLVLLALTLGAVLLLVVDVVLDRTVAVLLAGGFTVLTAGLWFVPPLIARRSPPPS